MMTSILATWEWIFPALPPHRQLPSTAHKIILSSKSFCWFSLLLLKPLHILPFWNPCDQRSSIKLCSKVLKDFIIETPTYSTFLESLWPAECNTRYFRFTVHGSCRVRECTDSIFRHSTRQAPPVYMLITMLCTNFTSIMFYWKIIIVIIFQ